MLQGVGKYNDESPKLSSKTKHFAHLGMLNLCPTGHDCNFDQRTHLVEVGCVGCWVQHPLVEHQKGLVVLPTKNIPSNRYTFK